MDRIRIVGGHTLSGRIPISGAKNAALPLMIASLLTPETVILENVPRLSDVRLLMRILGNHGVDASIDGKRAGQSEITGDTIRLSAAGIVDTTAPYELVSKMRASFWVLGPLLARCQAADVALPGGDNIGSRGLDMHVDGLRRMGAEVTSEHGYLIARADSGLHGATVWLDFPSVGATETLLMAAVTARGRTVVDNAAREPEIVDICTMLVEMGANIEGIGSSTLEIEGVEGLTPVAHATVADRIVAGTWAVAAVMTRGDITVRRAHSAHLEIALDKLVTAGASITTLDDGFRVAMDERPRAVDIVTLPYPGFPTDLQPQFIALNAIADGAALVTENLFEARFRFVHELVRLGADVQTEGHHALVRGREALSGAPVEATDIRAGAGLVLAGLVAEGETTVHEVHHIDRGYAGFVDDLRRLGADVARVSLPG